MRRVLCALAGAAVLATGVLPAAAQSAGDDGGYRSGGDPGGFVNIVPPGQDGVLNPFEALAAQAGEKPPHVQDQLAMYGDLVYEDATPGFTYAKILDHFKDASFGVPPEDIARSYHPGDRDDVVVHRDTSFGVPHIFGETREGTMFAAGYTGAEDRLFLMDVLRHLGRARLSEFLGPGNVEADREQLLVAPYTEEDLTEQIEQLRASGPEGEQIVEDALAYTAGVNQYIAEAIVDQRKLPAEYHALQQLPDRWIGEDIIAIASLVGGIFGKGGGGELRNACGLAELAASVGAEEARAIFDDLKFPDDAEAPTTSTRPAPYLIDLGPADPAANPSLDCDSLTPIAAGNPGPAQVLEAVAGAVPVPPAGGGSPSAPVVHLPWGGRIVLDFSSAMSNALLIGREHTASGKPIAVFGPQTGYFMPQLLVEKDIHGPGISARGVAFAGTDIFIQLGRGRDYAWSATSASADNVDTWVLELCEPEGGEPTVDSMGYRRGDDCLPIEAFDHTVVAKPSAGGADDFESTVWNQNVQRTEHYGFLVLRGTTSDGTPVALSIDRTTYGNELGSAPGFKRINDPGFMDGSVDAFRRAMGDGVDYTFNWFYIDDDDIAYQHSCRCPQRARGVDPYFPVWGNGEWDWRGFLPRARQPFDVNPPTGFITSWNNKQAPHFGTNDRQFSYGPVYRSLLFDDRIRAALAEGPATRPRMIDVMALAGTTDLRPQEVVDELFAVMGDRAPEGMDPRIQEMRDLIAAWAADDHGHRRDHDRDGAYEHAQAIAIMDAWWGLDPATSPLVRAIFGDAFDALGISVVDTPMGHIGSAFNGGAESHIDKDLRQVLGRDVTDPFSRTYCGDGDLEDCRQALWGSLFEASVRLEQEFDSSDIADWQRVPADDEIRHQAVGVTSVPPIHWVNRPTFQQVVEVGAPIDGPLEGGVTPGEPAPSGEDRVLPSTGAGRLGALVGLVLVAGAVGLRRRTAPR